MNQQEYFMKMQMLGQEAEQLEQQIQAIDQQISEMTSVKQSIDAISKNKNNQILANLGKGIFINAEIKSKELLVNVGKEILVKKSPEETLKVIDEQTQKLFSGKEHFMQKIQELQVNMQNLLIEAQNSSSHEHSCGDSCSCEEPCEDCECEKSGKKQKKK